MRPLLSVVIGSALVGVASCRQHPVIAPRVEPVVERGIAGVVFDSLAKAPLADARVELVDANHPERAPTTLVSDSAGGFANRDIALGKYLATFYHPRLDTLGVEAQSFLVELRGPSGVWLTLAIPSAARLRAIFCGGRASDSTGVLIGRAMDARTQSTVEGAVVTAEWLDVDSHPGRSVQIRRPFSTTRTRSDGSFTLCDVPLYRDFAIHGTHADERSGVVGIDLSVAGFGRRDLYLADSQHSVVRGNVIGGNGAPIPRARVSALNSTVEVTADQNGVFALPVERGGTQTVVVRAIGYHPEERSVDVRADSSTWVELTLATPVSTLDTMRVQSRGLDHDGFESRREVGIGTFLTSADIEATAPRTVADLIRRSPATPIVRLADGHLGVRVRGVSCLPMLVLNGHALPLLRDLGELDEMVDLTNIARMEIYTAGEIPREYIKGSPCAAIVVWTKRVGEPSS